MDADGLIKDIANQLKTVAGVQAVVLGGSRARGSHTPHSDIDLALYYDPAHPLDLSALGQLAQALDDTHRTGILTTPGEWGPWINGGGWLTVQSTAVDFLYRDLQKVQRVSEACRGGEITIDYQAGHPFGFVSAIYLAEVALCKILWEQDARVSSLKDLTCPYPPQLKHALITKFAWEIRFALDTGRKSADRQDVTYAAGCAFRAVMCMLQVLFALNETYWMNEKGALHLADAFTVKPPALRARLEQAFEHLGTDGKSIEEAFNFLEQVAQEIEELLLVQSQPL